MKNESSNAGKNASKATHEVPKSKYLYVIGAGHGGLNPSTGKYVTPGKRSPKFDDGTVLYEGVNNRVNVDLIIKKLHAVGIEAVDLVNDWRDISLGSRVARVNQMAKDRKCIYISIHSDAHGNGKEWTPASGLSAYTSVGQTQSDEFAELIIYGLQDNYEDTVKWRFDNRDGDKDKEAHFYVLRKTSCPAVLLEIGFHTNKEQATRMLTDEWREKLADSIVSACKIWEES